MTNETTRIAALEQALSEAISYIENKEANEGKLSSADQWKKNVSDYRASSISEISIGRSIVPEATFNYRSAVNLLKA